MKPETSCHTKYSGLCCETDIAELSSCDVFTHNLYNFIAKIHKKPRDEMPFVVSVSADGLKKHVFVGDLVGLGVMAVFEDLVAKPDSPDVFTLPESSGTIRTSHMFFANLCMSC